MQLDPKAVINRCHLEHIPERDRIDRCHLELIRGVGYSLKPQHILELGIGSGEGTKVLLDVIDYNGWGDLISVDNWYDWQGVRPEGLPEHHKLKIVEASEEEYVTSCTDKYDLILSDADHNNSHKWVTKTLDLLRPKGVAFFHDVTNPDFPNLQLVINHIKQTGYFHRIFTCSSKTTEWCYRGMLMIWK